MILAYSETDRPRKLEFTMIKHEELLQKLVWIMKICETTKILKYLKLFEKERKRVISSEIVL